jgi:hypothetical protein
MRRSEPPRAASWLLEHLVPGSMNDALAGDLAEEFSRRGAAWYWRQVLLAVAVGFFRHLRDEWFSIAFSFAWFYWGGESLVRLNTWLFSWAPHGAWWAVALPWPWSLVCEIATGVVQSLVPLGLGLLLYLLIARRFSFRGITAGFQVGIAALVAFWVGATFYIGNSHRPFPLLFPIGHSLVLLISIWAAQRRRSRRLTVSLS